LRLHPSVLALREKIKAAPKSKIFDVTLTYLTARGKWYLKSWKGDEEKSGGIAANIGVHFYDLLHFVFGAVRKNEIHYRDNVTSAGYLEYDKARVFWFLSIDAIHLPANAVEGEKLTYRSIDIEGEELEFSNGFTDLHTVSYRNILSGNGFGVEDNRSAISTVAAIRMNSISNEIGRCHFLLEKYLGE